jgi:1,4-alpha-glucan branching enzyme
MALAMTLLTPLSRLGNTTISAAWTTGTTTVPANSTVVYIVSGCAYSSAGVNAANFTLTTSAAGTATSIGNSGLSSNWGYGHKAFYVTNATGSDISTTLTVGVSTNDVMGEWLVTPIEFTGIAGTPFAGFVTGIAAGNVAQTLTLAATPVAGDYVIGALMGIATDGQTYAVTVGTGYTLASTSSDTVTESFTAVQYRTGSTSTAAGWANTGHVGSSNATEVQSIAFIVKAAAGGSPPVLSAATSSSIASTTATVGATTDTASGTLYAVAYTGTTPTAAQIKAGQNSSGVATPAANVAVSSTGAKTLNLTGLSPATAYNYALVHNSTNGDSNIVTGTFTTTTVATLSSPTPSGTQTTAASASVGATTNLGSGTMYVVVYTGTAPSATQIKAGQNSSGAATPNANVAVSSTGAKTLSVTGLTAGTAYSYSVIQNATGGDSNIVTGTFTTASAATLSAPTSASITQTSVSVGATTDTGAGTLYAVVYTGSAPSAAQIKAGQNASGATVPSANVAVSSTGAKTLSISGLTAGTAYSYSVIQNNGVDSNIVTGTFTTSAPSAATLSSPTSSSVTTTTATVGATTDTGAGTLYAVAYTGTQPSAAQIKAGQNSSGTATPFGSVAVSSTGAKTISLTGLTLGTAYNYALIQNNGTDSNIVTGTFTTLSPATLTSPTNASVTGSTALVGATSDKTGTMYIVASTTNSTPTATQIKAGQNAAGAAVPNISGSAAVGADTLTITGLTVATTYYCFILVNNAGGDSNIVSTSFTTSSVATPTVTLKQKWYQPAGQGNPATLVSGSNPMTVTAGSTLVALWTGADNGTIAAPLDNAGTFTIPTNGRQDAAGSDHIWAAIAHQANAAGGSHTITAPTIAVGGGGELGLWIVELTNMPSSINVRDVGFVNVIGTAQSWTVSSGTTPQVGDISFVITTYENTANFANAGLQNPPTGWTAIDVVQDATAFIPTQLSYKIVGSAGTQSAAYSTTDPTVSEHLGVMVTLVPTTSSVAPTLSSPTSSSVQTTTGIVGATTDTGSGTLYAVAYTGTQPTAAQIKAGQDSTGTAAPNANVAVSSTGAKTLSLSGLTAGTAYNYALVQNSGSDSNVVTGTFTTLAVPVLSSPTSSSVTSTTATVGATTTVGAGTLYAVAYTGTQPSAAQIKAGQNSSGATVPSGTVSVSSTGAKTINLTGLTGGTAYSYALVQNDGSDSNVVTGTFTTLVGAATLTSPLSSSVADVTATVGATTDTGSGTLYAVAYTGTQPSAAQIKLGQNSSGVATPAANAAVASTGAKTLNLTGLTASTAYSYALVQNTTGGDSNVVTGTFTTSATPVNITTTSSATPAIGSTLTITGTGFGASQGTGSVTIGGTVQTVTSWGNTSIQVTVSAGTNLYGVAVGVIVTNGSSVSSSSYGLTSLQPQAGWSYINLTTPNTTAANRITASPDIISGDQVTWDNKSGTVTVFSDGTFSSTVAQSFSAMVGVATYGYGSSALQTVQAITQTNIGNFHGSLASAIATLHGVSKSAIATRHGVSL